MKHLHESPVEQNSETLETPAAANSGKNESESPRPPTFTRDGIEEQHRFYPASRRTAWLASEAEKGDTRLPENGTVVITINGDVYIARMVNGKAVESVRAGKTEFGGGSGKPPTSHWTSGSGEGGDPVRWCRLLALSTLVGVVLSFALMLSGCR